MSKIQRQLGKAMAALVAVMAVAVVYGQVAKQAPKPCWRTRATIVRVIDGDTVEVEVRRTLTIRLLDCDSPEPRRTKAPGEKARGLAASAAMRSLVKPGDRVVVEIPTDEAQALSDIASFGRLLGLVWRASDGRSLGEAMIEQGHATKPKRE